MTGKLLIRDFGPIKDAELQIHQYNLLIGPQASGKSTISKVLAIIHTFDFFTVQITDANRNMVGLRSQLQYYRMENFLQSSTHWLFEDDHFRFELINGIIKVVHKKSHEVTSSRTGAYYLPAERIALPMIDEALFELSLTQTTLPKYFLEFGKDFTLARRRQQVFNLPLLGVEYSHNDGRNLVTVAPNQVLFLEQTSSAIQANLPLLVILQYPEKQTGVFAIEELELHGFPLLQKSLLYYVVERMRHSKLKDSYVILPTHSPYILSAANNLLLASKVTQQNPNSRAAVKAIIPSNAWISPDEFSAYYIADGTARSIVDRKTGLIDENMLDSVSEDLAEEFDGLMDLYKPSNS